MTTFNFNQIGNIKTTQPQAQPQAQPGDDGFINKTVIEIGKHVNKYAELCKTLGITEEQLNQICAQYPEFLSSTPAEQTNIVTKVTCPPVEEQKTDKKDNIDYSKLDYKQLMKDNAKEFNFAEFQKLSDEDKFRIYAEELVKNRLTFEKKEDFRFIEPNTFEKHVNAQLKSVIKNVDVTELEFHMRFLQCANAQGLSIKKFLKSRNKEEDYLNYISEIPENKLSDDMKATRRSNKLMADAIIDYLKTQPDYDNSYDSRTYFNRSERKQIAQTYHVNLDDLVYNYLKNKESRDSFETEALKLHEEKRQYKEDHPEIDDRKDFQEQAEEIASNPELRMQHEHGRIDKIMNDPIYGNRLKKAESKDEKVSALMSYIKSRLNKNEGRVIGEIIDELSLDPDNYEIVIKLAKRINRYMSLNRLKNIINETEKSEAGRTANRMTVGSLPEGEISTYATALYKATDEAEMTSDDQQIAERAVNRRLLTLLHVREDQMIEAQGFDSSNKKVQLATWAMTQRSETTEVGKKLMDIAVQEADKDVQNTITSELNSLKNDDVYYHALKGLTQDSKFKCSNTKTAVDSGLTEKAEPRRQQRTHETIQNSINQNFTGEQATEYSNKLTDQIANCAQENQQAMYEYAMQSSNKAAAQYAQQAYETRYIPVETATANNTSASAPASNYHTSPISSGFAEVYSTTAPANNTAEFSSPETKSVYQQLVSGEVSITQASDSFNRLTQSEKQEVLKSLPKSELLKMPVSICGFCPEFIPEFVAAHRGIEIIKTVPDAASQTVRCMKKSNDNKIKEQLNIFMLENPAMFMKISVEAAKKSLGIEDNPPTKPLQLRG